MDLTRRVPLGRTGLSVSRMGLASGYGLPAAAMEKAFHEYGVNYFYVSPLLNLGSMVQAVRNLLRYRDELFIILARPYLGGVGGLGLERYVERWLSRLGIEWVDLLMQDVRKPFGSKLTGRLQGIKDSGKIRFTGISSHDRPFIGSILRREAHMPADWFHIRYNAVHTGAEEDIFPYLPREDRPGIGIFTATCWRKLLKSKLMPAGEKPLTASDCYRFVLSNRAVDVCVTAPESAEQMGQNIKALQKGPLDADEMERVRRIGRYIYRN